MGPIARPHQERRRRSPIRRLDLIRSQRDWLAHASSVGPLEFSYSRVSFGGGFCIDSAGVSPPSQAVSPWLSHQALRPPLPAPEGAENVPSTSFYEGAASKSLPRWGAARGITAIEPRTRRGRKGDRCLGANVSDCWRERSCWRSSSAGSSTTCSSGAPGCRVGGTGPRISSLLTSPRHQEKVPGPAGW
jgi:hypothetical protein